MIDYLMIFLGIFVFLGWGFLLRSRLVLLYYGNHMNIVSSLDMFNQIKGVTIMKRRCILKMLVFAFAYFFVPGGCATIEKTVVQPVGAPQEMNITTTDGVLSITVLGIQKAKIIRDKKEQVSAGAGKLFHVVDTEVECKSKSWRYGRKTIWMMDKEGKPYTLTGEWTSSTLHIFGHETFVFEIPEEAHISALRFGPLPPIDMQRRVVVDISQEISQIEERQKALEWVQANTLSGDLDAQFLKNLDDAIAMGVSIKWYIGRGLTSSKKPYIVHWTDGRFKFEELTIEEAEKKGIEEHSVKLLRRPDETWTYF
jgi:hypothetical protein